MAEIFLAKAMSIQGMEKTVAIKRVLPSLTKNKNFIDMFLDEARLSIRLNHANIVQVIDVNRSGETYFIVMEFVDGYNVRRIFQRANELGKRIPIASACYLMMEVCKGLQHAHTKRDDSGKHLHIVHRDLSPPNILVSKSGEVKITDFGLAKATSQLTKTDPGIVKGKYSYLCPEVTDGKQPDLRADIFAAGVVLWELLANRRLFLASTDGETVDLVRKANVPKLSKFNADVSPELERIIGKALERDPKKRYTTARHFGDAIADFLFKNNLKTTSYDLAKLVDGLFGKASTDGAAVGADRIEQMIVEEINNLSMLGFSSSVRGLEGGEAIKAESLPSVASATGRFDLSDVWRGGSEVKVRAGNSGTRTQTLKAMEELRSASQLIRMLEGEVAPAPSAVAAAGASTDVAAPSDNTSVPAKSDEKSGGAGFMIILLGLIVAAGVVAYFIINR